MPSRLFRVRFGTDVVPSCIPIRQEVFSALAFSHIVFDLYHRGEKIGSLGPLNTLRCKTFDMACLLQAIDGNMNSDRLVPVHAFQSGFLAVALLVMPSLTRGEEPRLVTPMSPVLTAPAPATTASSPLLPSSALSSGTTNSVFSQPPTLAGRYTVHGSTVIPYIGLGFHGGETTDMNRTIARQNIVQSAVQQDRLFNDMLGKSLVPNEFQVGIRIPF